MCSCATNHPALTHEYPQTGIRLSASMSSMSWSLSRSAAEDLAFSVLPVALARPPFLEHLTTLSAAVFFAPRKHLSDRYDTLLGLCSPKLARA